MRTALSSYKHKAISMEISVYRSIEEALEDNFVCVYNATDQNGKRARGLLFLEVKEEGEDNPDSIPIPPVWVPIDLSAFASLEALGKSRSLKTAVRKGMLLLVKKDTVKSFEAQAGYEEEKSKATRKTDSLLRGGANFVNDISEEGKVSISLGDNSAPTITPAVEDNVKEVPYLDRIGMTKKVALTQIVALNEKGSIVEINSALAGCWDTLVKEDFEYLSQAATNKASYVFAIACEGYGRADDSSGEALDTKLANFDNYRGS